MIDIELSDLPGGALIGSIVAMIGDIILFSGDIIMASLGALLSNVEIVGSLISTMGRAASESGILSAPVADQLSVAGIFVLLGGLGLRAVRIIKRDISKRINS